MKYQTAIPQFMVVWLLLLLLPPSLVLCRVPMPMPMVVSHSASAMGTTTGEGGPSPLHCPQKCGNVSIPYPFGIGQGCWWRESFAIECNNSHSPPRPYYRGYEVIDISLKTGEMRVITTKVAHVCYNSTNTTTSSSFQDFSFSPFLISPEKNQFTGIGCHTVALLGGKDWDGDGSYLSGCVSTCKRLEDAAGDGHNCSGRGCCQMPTSSGLHFVKFGWSGKNSFNRASNFSSCSYSFVAQRGKYRFQQSDLTGVGEMAFDRQFREKRLPLVLSWGISNNDSHLCVSNHSELSNSNDVTDGYLCTTFHVS